MSMGFNKYDTVSMKSGVSGISTGEDLCDDDLVLAVERVTTNIRNLTLENMVLERYLVKVDPEAAVGLQQLLDQAAATVAIHSRIHAATSTIVHGASSSATLKELSSDQSSPSPSGISHSVVKFRNVSCSDKAPSINVYMKMDIVDKLIEEAKHDLDTMRVKSQQSRINIHAEVEESNLMLQELKDSEDALEARVVRGVDQLTGRIPAERFVRHMEQWLKKANFLIEKLRLHTSTLKSKNISVQQQVVQKEELGEVIQPVDFLRLQIQNQDLIVKLDEKNCELIELKKITGNASLMLTTHKNQLMEQVNKLSEVRRTVKERNAQIKAFKDEGARVENELEKADDNYESIRELVNKYTVPNLMDYVKIKAELHELSIAVKIWTRRRKIQQSALASCHATLRRVSDESQKDRKENVTTKIAKANSSEYSK